MGEVKNVVLKQEGSKLHIIVDTTKEYGPSASGKTTIIASTGGAVPHPETPEIKINLNVYKPKK